MKNILDTLRYLITYEFWFEIHTAITSRASRVYLVIAGLLLLSAIVLYIRSRKESSVVVKKYLKRYIPITVTIGLLEAVWFWLREQDVTFLGSHFVGTIILLIGVAWVYPTVKYRYARYKTEKVQEEKEQLKLKYLEAK